MNTAQLAVDNSTVIPISDAAAGVGPRGVRVHAIGSVRVSLGRLALQSLGGPKAGAKQALGLFGFLFDRANRGVEKDEAVEVIWPDMALSLADAAFHRTMLGLRGTLHGGGFGDPVEFRNGRYVLASGLISWSDTAELERFINASAATTDSGARIELLERCRQLNAADYMDDCPFFGSSVYVEQRRTMLRAVRHAVLLELAEMYAAAGHLALATIRRAEAQAIGD